MFSLITQKSLGQLVPVSYASYGLFQWMILFNYLSRRSTLTRMHVVRVPMRSTKLAQRLLGCRAFTARVWSVSNIAVSVAVVVAMCVMGG